jgi:hypothetical protein
MILTAAQLIHELSAIVDAALAKAIVESYVETQQRYLIGDWGPTELDGGRLCEAAARCIHQLDTGSVTHTKLPGKITERLVDESVTTSHRLNIKDRHHLAKAISIVYKFRSDRGAVHISPDYTANEMDSVFVLHAGKWILSEFLRIAWNKDRDTIAQAIARIVRLEHSLIHELDGKPLVLVKGISAPNEILLLLNHATGNRLTRAKLREQATHQKPANVNIAINRLLEDKAIREAEHDEIVLTPIGQKKIVQELMPLLADRSA